LIRKSKGQDKTKFYIFTYSINDMVRKKIKIIRENVKQPFKEVKEPEKEETAEELEKEENLEEEVQPQEIRFENFSDFTSDIAAPVLEATDAAQATGENLEQETEEAPTPTTEEAEQETYVINMPDYGPGVDYEARERERRERDREMNITPLIPRQEQAQDIRTIRGLPEEMREPEARQQREDYERLALKKEQEREELPPFRETRRRRKRVV
jgi:hypothetical protein